MKPNTIQSVADGIDLDPLCGATWGKVAYLCGLGSTSAVALCHEFAVDPDRDCGKEIG